MKIKVNGKDQVLDKSRVSVSELLVINNVEMPDMVSVQLNDKFVKREDFTNTQLTENDEIDFLYFMGGGADPRCFLAKARNGRRCVEISRFRRIRSKSEVSYEKFKIYNKNSS